MSLKRGTTFCIYYKNFSIKFFSCLFFLIATFDDLKLSPLNGISELAAKRKLNGSTFHLSYFPMNSQGIILYDVYFKSILRFIFYRIVLIQSCEKVEL